MKSLKPTQQFSQPQLAAFIGVFVVIGVAVVALIYAAGAAALFEPENGVRTGGATVVAAAGASGGHAIQFGAATPTPTPAPTPTSTPTPSHTPTPSPTPAPLTKVKIWPIGDSITSGQLPEDANGYRLGVWNGLTGAGYSLDFVGTDNYGLPTLPDWDTNGEGGTCIRSPNCYTTDPADLRYNLTQASMSSLNPDIVIMNGGGNDFCCGNSQDPVRVEGYMQQWIQLMYSIKPSVDIIVLGQVGDYHTEYDNWTQQYVSQLKSQGKHIDYVYAEDVTTNDTVHPDLAGYQTIVSRMVPELLPMMRQLTGH